MGKNKELEFFRPSRQFNLNRQYLMEGLVEFSRVGYGPSNFLWG